MKSKVVDRKHYLKSALPIRLEFVKTLCASGTRLCGGSLRPRPKDYHSLTFHEACLCWVNAD